MKSNEMIEIEALKDEIEGLKMQFELLKQATEHIQMVLILMCERLDKGE